MRLVALFFATSRKVSCKLVARLVAKITATPAGTKYRPGCLHINIHGRSTAPKEKENVSWHYG
nr:MAG TPA: hypothetical protein [Caudoviricetes sp.]